MEAGTFEPLLLSQVVEQTADSVIITDLKGVIAYVNPAFEALTGYSRDEALGKRTNFLKSGEYEASFYEAMWQTILSGKPFQAEMSNRKKNGELYYTAKIITPLKNDQGDILRFVSTDRDVTEHKRLGDEITRLRIEEEKLETIRILSSTYAHHVFNAMTPIQGYADLILRRANLAEEHRNWLQLVKKNVTHVVDLVQKLERINSSQLTNFGGVNIYDIADEEL